VFRILQLFYGDTELAHGHTGTFPGAPQAQPPSPHPHPRPRRRLRLRRRPPRSSATSVGS